MGAALKMQVENSWHDALADQFASVRMQALQDFLTTEKQAGKTIFPAEENYFRALDLTPLDDVKVVILGQDPYHGDGQAHGLSFSVQKGVKIPPSLRNIYKELQSDIGMETPEHGFLENWARQGVLMLNTCLSVEKANAGSHQGKGWEEFTDAVIQCVNNNCDDIVFLLWGSHAEKKADMIDQGRHCVLQAPHPSPFSAYRGFLGSQHFSKTNEYLKQAGKTPIDWSAL